MPKTKPARLPKDTTREDDLTHIRLLVETMRAAVVEMRTLEAKAQKQRHIVHDLVVDFKRKWKEAL